MSRNGDGALRMSSFHNPTRVAFGPGAVARLGEQVAAGAVALVTTPGSTRRGLTARVTELLEEEGRVVASVVDDVRTNPDVRDLLHQLDRIPRDAAGVVAVGGGSAMDTGKVLAALARARRSGDARPALEAALRGRAVEAGGSLPVVCVPTTAGTGAEVTPFATVWDGERMLKASVAGPGMFPAAAVVDPDLTVSLPESETVSTGLDALSQGLEAWWNRNAGPVTDAFATRAARLALETLEPLVGDLGDRSLRAAMSEASLLAGLAISGTRTAAAHSISYPLTLRFGIPHGLACGFTLPVILQYNNDGGHPRLAALAEALGSSTVGDLVDRLRRLLRCLGVGPRIREHGFDPAVVRGLGPEMITPGRADNNLRAVDAEQAARIALMSWEQIDG